MLFERRWSLHIYGGVSEHFFPFWARFECFLKSKSACLPTYECEPHIPLTQIQISCIRRTKRRRNSSGHSRSGTPASTISQRIALINSYRKRLRHVALTMRSRHMSIASRCNSATETSNAIITKTSIWDFPLNCCAVWYCWCWARHCRWPFFHVHSFCCCYFWPPSFGLRQYWCWCLPHVSNGFSGIYRTVLRFVWQSLCSQLFYCIQLVRLMW